MTIRRQAALLLLIICMMTAVFTPYTFATQESETVRVGFYEDGDYMSRNENGDYIGFNFEYLQELAKYTGWKYQIVDCKSWENTYNMLKQGKIDVLPSVFLTDERTQEISFASVPMSNSYTTLNVRKDDNRYGYEDFSSFSGMKVGIIQGSLDAENFLEYCRINQLTVSVNPYRETGALLDDLRNGKLDGIAITHLGKDSTFRSIAQFSPAPLYMAVSKNRPDLLKTLEEALNAMKLRDPYYDARLYEKYLSVSASQVPVFTKEELEYIESAGSIQALFDPNWEPLSYLDSQTGQFSGIIADLFQQIEQDSGLKFEYVPMDGAEIALNKQGIGNAQVICGVESDYLWDAKKNLNTTGYFLSVPVVRISANHEGEAKRIAMPEGLLISKRVAEYNPDKQMRYYASIEECFDALLRGDVDETYANTYAAEYLLRDMKYQNFVVTTLANYNDEISIGVSKSADPRLFSILDRCVQYLSAEQMDSMVMKNSLVQSEVTWKDAMRQHPFMMAGILVAFFTFITLILIYVIVVKTRSHQKIQKLLYRDVLTEMWNLSGFQIEAKKQLDKEDRGEYAIIYSDINQFKTINDTYGFDEGDWLLQTFGQVLEQSIGEGECCGRVSADHFVFLLRYHSWEELWQRTSSIDGQINDMIRMEDKRYHLILIFGVFVIPEDEERDISMILDLANYARRSAKDAHKSRLVRYDEKMRKEELVERDLADEMEEALAKGEFVPYFQPKVNMLTREIVGSEALVRWNHPERGLIPPMEFLPFFERNGFIVEVDLFMFETVCKTIRRWMDEGMPIQPVSCNFSRIHFRGAYFPEVLCEIADRYEVPHKYLELEITESIVMEDPDRVMAHFSQLQELGFSLSIDDFGSGYSSLGMLQRFAADVLKLDRSFLQQGIQENRSQTIIRGIVALASELNMSIVCEGVEGTEQSELLIGMGCFVAQSFYYGRPVPLDEFEQLWQKGNLKHV